MEKKKVILFSIRTTIWTLYKKEAKKNQTTADKIVVKEEKITDVKIENSNVEVFEDGSAACNRCLLLGQPYSGRPWLLSTS